MCSSILDILHINFELTCVFILSSTGLLNYSEAEEAKQEKLEGYSHAPKKFEYECSREIYFMRLFSLE